ncbi:iron-containing alcohol dehydrogenase family protein [Cohnella sp. AR92]|uniref:iron-containing alcohol dehydrogenase family protein n=1 Tax=Cohnella sp. AR92 TaxID=648716 RepID=UPI000F8D7483|nr:iron-containing alcohol dehydrogenase family protein [Cohnella sp. AR92]RUS42834.1 iron-containing alcohol dehydrogenase family protein [Cohnella sp. AR92]
MIVAKTPAAYSNEPGNLGKAGPRIAALGSKVYAIAGRTAWSKAGPALTDSLKQEGIVFSVRLLEGPCTLANIERLSEEAERFEVDVILGIGGGTVLDLTKAVGDRLGLPVVTVPTIAATCAAWSALTVLYDDEGRSAGYLPLGSSPALVLADTGILSDAPRRYLASGIGDTLVKWYEIGINVKPGELGGLDARIGLSTSRLALDILKEHAVPVYNALERHESHPAFADVTDSIFLLAGLVGSVTSEVRRAGFAHAIHDALTWLPETHGSLHGEKVAFGLLAQLVLEGKRAEAEELARLHRSLDLPITLQELGIVGDSSAAIAAVASRIRFPQDVLDRLAFEADADRLAAAIAEADRIGRTIIHSQIPV